MLTDGDIKPKRAWIYSTCEMRTGFEFLFLEDDTSFPNNASDIWIQTHVILTI